MERTWTEARVFHTPYKVASMAPYRSASAVLQECLGDRKCYVMRTYSACSFSLLAPAFLRVLKSLAKDLVTLQLFFLPELMQVGDLY